MSSRQLYTLSILCLSLPYFDLGKDKVLAFQFNLTSTIGNTPVRDLASIGSSAYIRGYSRTRQRLFRKLCEYR